MFTETVMNGPPVIAAAVFVCGVGLCCRGANGGCLQKVTALAPESQDFENMYQQVKDLKEGKAIQKPIYNHVSGLLDPPEEIKAPQVLSGTAPHPAGLNVLTFVLWVGNHNFEARTDVDGPAWWLCPVRAQYGDRQRGGGVADPGHRGAAPLL